MQVQPTIRRTLTYVPPKRTFPRQELAPGEVRALRKVLSAPTNIEIFSEIYVRFLSFGVMKAHGTKISNCLFGEADEQFRLLCGQEYEYLKGLVGRDMLIISRGLFGVQQIEWRQLKELLILRGKAFRSLCNQYNPHKPDKENTG